MAPAGRPCGHEDIKTYCPACDLVKVEQELEQMTVKDDQAYEHIERLCKEDAVSELSEVERQRIRRQHEQWTNSRKQGWEKIETLESEKRELAAKVEELVEASTTDPQKNVWTREMMFRNAEKQLAGGDSARPDYLSDLATVPETQTATGAKAPSEKRLDRTKLKANLDYLLDTPYATSLVLRLAANKAITWNPTMAPGAKQTRATVAYGTTLQPEMLGPPTLFKQPPKVQEKIEEDGSLELSDLRRIQDSAYEEDVDLPVEGQLELARTYHFCAAFMLETFLLDAQASSGDWKGLAAENEAQSVEPEWQAECETVGLPEDNAPKAEPKQEMDEHKELQRTFGTFTNWLKKQRERAGDDKDFIIKLGEAVGKRKAAQQLIINDVKEYVERLTQQQQGPEPMERPTDFARPADRGPAPHFPDDYRKPTPKTGGSR